MHNSISPSMPAKRCRDSDSSPTMIVGIADSSLFGKLTKLPQEQQTKILRSMSERLDFSSALFIHSLLGDRLLQMPLLDSLSKDTLLRIIKHLDHKSLLFLGFCSQSFYDIIFSDQGLSSEVWEYCAHITDPLPCEANKRMVLRAGDAGYLKMADYSEAYKWLHEINRNWTLNLCRTAVIEIPGSRTITDMCADWDKKRLFVASDDSLMRVYEYENGLQLTGLLAGHQGGIWCMKAVGDCLITGSTDRSIGIWDLKSMTRQSELLGHSSTIRSLLVHQQYVISGSRDGIIRVWEWMTGRTVHVLTGHSASIRCLELFVDRDDNMSAYIISGSYDETAIIWSLSTGKLVHRLEGHTGRIYTLKVHNSFIYTAGLDHRVKKWDLYTGECVADIFTCQSLIGMICAHEKFIATGSTDGKVCVFDATTNTLLYTIQLDSEGNSIPPVTSVSINNKFLLVTSDCAAYVFNTCDGTKVNSLLQNRGTVWRGTCTDCHCFIAYQQNDSTRLFAADFRPISNLK